MTKDKIKGFLAGIVTMALIFSMSLSVYAISGSKSITASYNNIKLYVDHSLFVPKDVAGNVVEPFIYNGTTYVPIRAVAEALGQTVTWDQATKSVYIGSTPSTPALNQVLMEKNDVKIIYTGVAKNSSYLGGYVINLRIENNSTNNYTVQVRNFSLNGVMCDTIFSCDVSAGKIAVDEIMIPESAMNKISQTSVTSFETNFHIYSEEDWSDTFDSTKVKVSVKR